jgi:hypothetical protein
MITALMIMSILSIIGIYANSIATTELQITTNVETSNMAFYNADAGVQHTLARIKQQLNAGSNISNIDLTDSDYQPPNGFSFVVTTEDSWSGSGPHKFVSTGSGPRESTNSIEVTFTNTLETHPAFKVGILSDGDITINGAPNITGSMHANGNIDQGGNGTINGSVSAVGTTNVGSVVSESVTSGADEMDVPMVTQTDFLYWEGLANIHVLAEDLPKQGNKTQPYEFPPDGDDDYNNIIVFVDGDITVNGNTFQNVTFVATGEINVNGASAMNADGSIGTAMIAGGDIIFNGSSTLNGAFWCNGSAVWNGSGFVHGAIVSRGNITRNGVMNFVYHENITNENLPQEMSVKMASWADKGLL